MTQELRQLVTAIETNDFWQVKRLSLNRKLFNMRVHGRNGQTPLIIASQQETLDIEIIKCLISSGSASNMKDYSGKTPFVHACECGNFEIAKTIYEKAGKGKNAIRFVISGDDPLTLSVRSGNENLVSWLLSTEIIRSSRKRALLASIEKGYWMFKLVFDHCCLDSYFNWLNILKLSCGNIQIDMLKLLLPKCKEIGPLELDDYAQQSSFPNVRDLLLSIANKKRQDIVWSNLKPAFLIRENARAIEYESNLILSNHPISVVCEDVFNIICSYLVNKPTKTSVIHFFEKEDGVKIWHFYDGGRKFYPHSWSDDEDWNYSDDGYDY